MTDSNPSFRDRLPAVLALGIGIMALSNLLKPVGQLLAPDSPTGFVFFGTRLTGTANAVVGPAFGIALAAYSYGAWTMRRWVLPIAIAYALYVPVNLLLFMLNPPPGDEPTLAFGLAYSTVALTFSVGGAALLFSRRDELK